MENLANFVPHNHEAESAILGACLLDNNHISTAVELLTETDFHDPRNGVIFSAISKMYQSGAAVDIITAMNNLTEHGTIDGAGGIAYLSGLTNTIPCDISSYCRIVSDCATKKRIMDGCNGVLVACTENSGVSVLLDKIHTVAGQIHVSSSGEPKLVSELSGIVLAELEEKAKQKTTITGLRTGLTDLDRHMGGLQKSNYIVVAGRPGMGKTSLAVKFLLSAAEDGVGALMFSMEMKNTRLASRLLSMKSGVNGREMMTGNLKDADWPKILYAQKQLDRVPLIIDDSCGLSIAELIAKAKKVSLKMDLGLIVVDYIQLMKGPRSSENRTRELAEISAGLLSLAKELDLPVVVLSQLNRGLENRNDKRPVMSDLRESGAIEQDADVICFIYRDEVYNDSEDNPNRGIAELIIAKGRDIGTRTVRVGWVPENTNFVNLAYEEYGK